MGYNMPQENHRRRPNVSRGCCDDIVGVGDRL